MAASVNRFLYFFNQILSVFTKEQLAADKKEEEGLIQRINKIEHNQINLDNQIKGLANKLDKILEKLG